MNMQSKLCVLVALISLFFAPGCVTDRTPVKSVQEQRVQGKPKGKKRAINGFMEGVATVVCISGGGLLGAAGCGHLLPLIGFPIFWGVLGGIVGGAAFGGVGGYLASRKMINSENSARRVVSADSNTIGILQVA